MTTADPLPGLEPTPLDIARDWAGRVRQIAAHYEQRERADPGFGTIEAQVHGAGRQQFEAAQMASFMALVSIAEDVHRIASVLGKFDAWADANDGAIADARATREHMKHWAEGDETHPGEAT